MSKPNFPDFDNIPSMKPIDYSKYSIPKFDYDDTFLKDMANDIKQPLERQLRAVENIADSAKRQAVSSEEIAKVAKDTAENAKNTSLSAKLKANKSFIVSIISLLVAVLSNLDRIVINLEKAITYLSSLIR